MDKKFELTNESINVRGKTLYRIRALKDFGDVKKGNLGGFVESYNNLFEEGNCWIYNDAKVFGNAGVHDNARICGNAEIFNNAIVFDNALICDNAKIFNDARIGGNAVILGDVRIYNCAKVYDDALIRDNVKIFGSAEVYNNAKICDYAMICDNAKIFDYARIGGTAQIYGNAEIYNNARVYDNAMICDNVKVFGSAEVFKNARICDDAKIYDNAGVYDDAVIYGKAILKEEQIVHMGCCKTDLSKNLKESIRCQTNLFPQKDYVIAYKQVHKDLTSLYDKTFQYKIGEWAEVEEPEISSRACASGLHFSNVNYWDMMGRGDITYLMAKIMLDDIITVQQGKIRCKRAFIIDKYEIED